MVANERTPERPTKQKERKKGRRPSESEINELEK